MRKTSWQVDGAYPNPLTNHHTTLCNAVAANAFTDDNTGSTPWVRNTSTQVNLAICREDKVTCNVFSPWASWNDGWLSSIAYATHVQDTVAPGAVATFKYRIRPPFTAACQIHHFNGDLVLAATLSPLHPQGYFQDATISC